MLKAPRVRKEKLVGVYMPPQFDQYLIFYAMAKGLSKSQVVRQLLLDWRDNKPPTYQSEPERDLINQLAEKVSIDWSVEKSNNPDLFFTDYRDYMRRKLERRGIRSGLVKATLGIVAQEMGDEKEWDT